MSVRITSVIEECVFDVVVFSETHINHKFLIGRDSMSIKAPRVMSKPNCGYKPKIASYSISPISLPEGFTLEQLITIDSLEDSYRIESTKNLALYRKEVFFKIIGLSPGYPDLEAEISVYYDSDGP